MSGCPTCGAPRELRDRICRACHTFFEAGRVLDLEPPRARERGGRPAPAPRPDTPLRKRVRRALAEARLDWRTHAVAGIVPGLGHVLAGLRREGAAFAGLIGALLAVSVVFFSITLGQLFFGVAMAAHAYSIFKLTPWRDAPAAWMRIVAVLAIQAPLTALWWPLLRVLANAFVAPERLNNNPFAPLFRLGLPVVWTLSAALIVGTVVLVGVTSLRASRALREE